MVEAMVQDTGAHLENIQKKRDELEAMIAEGKPDDAIHQANQSLACDIKDYKVAAAHVKKHCSKPKKAKEPDQVPTPAETAEWGWTCDFDVNLGGGIAATQFQIDSQDFFCFNLGDNVMPRGREMSDNT